MFLSLLNRSDLEALSHHRLHHFLLSPEVRLVLSDPADLSHQCHLLDPVLSSLPLLDLLHPEYLVIHRNQEHHLNRERPLGPLDPVNHLPDPLDQLDQ